MCYKRVLKSLEILESLCDHKLYCKQFHRYTIKLIPSASVELAGQEIPSGFAVFLRLAPIHIPSVLLLFISRPEHS